MSNPFSSLWSAMKRLAASFNRLADNVDAMSEQIETRQLIDEQPPKLVEDLNGRRKVAAK